MAIRFKKYKNKAGDEVQAVRVTAHNYQELADYINKNRGTAVAEQFTATSGDVLNQKVRLMQTNTFKNGLSSRGARVARVGDVVVRIEVVDKVTGKKSYDFKRVKEDDFDEYELV